MHIWIEGASEEGGAHYFKHELGWKNGLEGKVCRLSKDNWRPELSKKASQIHAALADKDVFMCKFDENFGKKKGQDGRKRFIRLPTTEDIQTKY